MEKQKQLREEPPELPAVCSSHSVTGPQSLSHLAQAFCILSVQQHSLGSI